MARWLLVVGGMTATCLVFAVLGLTACVGDDEQVARVSAHAQLVRPDDVVEENSVCDRLPSCGPCSLLCDLQALADEYVPVGTCAVFVCELTDGEMVIVHACHPQ